MIRFRLLPFMGGSIERMVMKTNPEGGYISARLGFTPGVEYTATDPVVISYIKGKVGDVREKSLQTPQLLEALKTLKIPYEVKVCRTCSGSKPSLLYNPFQILEETNE